MVKIIKDPVCGMEADEKKIDPSTIHEFIYNGKTYYFCSEECLEKFKKDPERYIKKK